MPLTLYCGVPVTVAPFVGAWIEIDIDEGSYYAQSSLRSSERGLKFAAMKACTCCLGRSVRRSVDWNRCVPRWASISEEPITSLRSSERGLKFILVKLIEYDYSSLRSSERGLKLSYKRLLVLIPGRSVRRSVDWNAWSTIPNSSLFVAPFVGAWIEIGGTGVDNGTSKSSLRSSERGLKFSYLFCYVNIYGSLRSSERGLK